MNFHPIHIIGLLSIKATQNIKPVVNVVLVYYNTLMECTGCWLKLVNSNLPGPSLSLKLKFMNIIESLLRLINTPEDVHRGFCCTGTVAISTLHVTVHPNWFEPYFPVEVQYREVVQRPMSIPASKYVHQVLVKTGCVPKPQL